MRIKLLCFMIIMDTIAFAQIDTTDWYPLHIGDKWEYYGQGVLGYEYSRVEVLGDTLMPNGKIYSIFSDGVDAWRFQRKENNDIVYGYNYTNNTDYILFNFMAEEKSLWPVPFDDYWGIIETNTDNQNLLNLELQYKIFDRAIIDSTINPPDTIWGYVIDAYPTRVTKGLGVTSYTYGLTYLVGAVINGVGYGTLVNVEDEINKSISNNFNLYQNYPNPFNASTIIRYEISDSKSGSHNIQLSAYNSLGQEVAVLVNKAQKPGSYEIMFDGGKLPSGTYFIQLTTGEYKKTIKALLME